MFGGRGSFEREVGDRDGGNHQGIGEKEYSNVTYVLIDWPSKQEEKRHQKQLVLKSTFLCQNRNEIS